MTTLTRTTLALLTSLCLAAGLCAQTPDSTRSDSSSVDLGEIVVRAARPLTTVGGASAVRLHLDSLALPPAPSLELALRQLPLLHVRRNSRGEAELSARGSESRQVAVLVDGIPLTLAWDGRLDASVLPLGAPQRLEYTRGLSSMLYGPNVLGGIVEITVGRSLIQPARPALRLTTGVDDLGGVGGAADAALPFETAAGRWLVRAGMGYSDSPGQPLAGGITEPGLPGTDRRLNTDAHSVDGFATVRFHGNGGGWVALSGSSFEARRGIAAELGVDQARFWRYPHLSRTLVVASAGTGERRGLFGGRGDLEASLGVDLGRTDIDAYTSRRYDALDGFEDGRDRGLTARVLADQSLGHRADLHAALTLSDIRHDERLPDGEARYRQRLWSAGLESTWRAIEEGSGVSSLRFTVGAAYDGEATPETGGREPLGTLGEWGGRIGFTMGLGQGATEIHGGVSRRARFPSLRELYSGALNRFAPNPDLRPENLVAMEAGLTRRFGRSELQVVGFRHQIRDAVVRITLPDHRFMRVNRNQLRSYGVEMLASVPVGPLTVAGDLTVQSVTLTDPDALVANRPENLPEVFGSLRARMSLGLGLIGGGDLVVTGNQYCIDPGTGSDRRLDGGALVNAELSRTFAVRSGGLLSNLEARVAVDNVGDAARFDQCGLPRPGRLLRFQLRLF